MTKDPFSKQRMDEIFKVDNDNNQLIISRESTTLEFKESFGLASMHKYAKTMAAFANTQGGYIIFGVKNRPHTPVGLDGKKLETFDSLDPEKLSDGLNGTFSPEINWTHAIYDFDNKKFGVIYTYPSQSKPVVCIKNEGDLYESDIYYRYRGRSQRIKYPELRKLIEEVRIKEERLWLHHISKIASIGVADVGIFNFRDGTTTSGNGGKFIIDENLLASIKFIKEGEFNERKGAPAIKIIGQATGFSHIVTAKGKPTVIHAKGIRLHDIVLDFLTQNKVQCPEEYLAQICCETTAFLPIYYYQRLAKLSKEDTIRKIDSITSRAQGKEKLKQRIQEPRTFYKPFKLCDTAAGRERKKFTELLEKEEMFTVDLPNDALRVCECVRNFSQEYICAHDIFLRNMLKELFVQFYENSSFSLSSILRSAICWIDEAMFFEGKI